MAKTTINHPYTKPRTGMLVLGVVAAVVLVLLLWIAGSYNGLVRLDEGVNEKWANVEADYQRRADLIPNLVATVERYTDYEGSVLREVTEARSAWARAATVTERQAAASGMDSALSRLIAVAENYPNLKANEAYLSLQDELAGTENRIKVSRTEYNGAIRSYNTRVRSFPANIIAGMFGFDQRTAFEAQDGAEIAPSVNDLFGTA